MHTSEFQKVFKRNTNPKGVMGRVKSQLIKRTSTRLTVEHKKGFKEDFEENKKSIGKYAIIANKKIRNRVAGHITKLMKVKEEE